MHPQDICFTTLILFLLYYYYFNLGIRLNAIPNYSTNVFVRQKSTLLSTADFGEVDVGLSGESVDLGL